MFRSQRPFGIGFCAQRSLVLAQRGMVCASQPLAASVGLQVLRSGGNALDAAIATNLALCVVEPYNTGLGGDCMLLYWHAGEQKLYALNGSGRAPQGLTADHLEALGYTAMPLIGPLSITVPGAVRAWADAHARFGCMPWTRLFEGALDYAQNGFPVTEVIAWEWQTILHAGILQDEHARQWFSIHGRPPELGEIVRLPALARSLRELAQGGPDWFYSGPFAHAAAPAVGEQGGVLTAADFTDHASQWVDPVETSYRGYVLVELPPNTQGLTALLALNILENFDLPRYEPGAPEVHHFRIEAVKLAFADRNAHLADPEFAPVPVQRLLSKDYAQGRAALLKPTRALAHALTGKLLSQGDTVYLTAADRSGNVVSMISSLFFPFGSGVAVPDAGVVLQNRGAGFVLDRNHPNCVAPRKRPLHTIIPAMLLRDGRPVVSFGVMGGDHQAQAHVQVVSQLVDFGANIQEALDRPRFHVLERNRVALEEEFEPALGQALSERGHALADPNEVRLRGGFGGGQGIMIAPHTGAYWGGSDRRKDGLALGF
ncbi:MAG: gamma-glutamyltransferase [Candidatus Binatia bacterium]|nr:gamma-glutamyltransferase [Candidatus Binatia bacterium]